MQTAAMLGESPAVTLEMCVCMDTGRPSPYGDLGMEKEDTVLPSAQIFLGELAELLGRQYSH